MIPQIPDHTLVRRIGRGSYGEVWLARNVMGAWRAVKLVWRDRFPSARPFDREFEGIRKFEPVSRAHDSQVDILHVGRDEAAGLFYYVMELGDDRERVQQIEADNYTPRTLASDLATHGRLRASETIAVGIALAEALEHLHAHGLIHRDIKPSNVIFVHGRPKLADIGLVAGADEEVSFVGTEGFVPPEGPGTMRADLFSLGKVLYQLHTGLDRSRFPELPAELLENEDAEMARELNLVILKAAAPEAVRRHSSSRELREELLLLQSGHSIRKLRAAEQRVVVFRWLGVAAAVVAILSVVAWIAARKSLSFAESARLDAENSRAELERNLADARLSQLRSLRERALAGERGKALEIIAAEAKRNAGPQLLNEAIAQLARYDFGGLASEKAESAGADTTASGAWRVDWSGGNGPVLRSADGKELSHPADGTFPKSKPVFAVHPTRPVLVFAQDGILQGRRLDTWEQIATQPLETPATALALNGDTVAVGDANGGLRLWNYYSGKRRELRAHRQAVDALFFAPSGDALVSHSTDGEARFWDPVTERLLLTAPGVKPIGFSADGTALRVEDGSGVRAWRLEPSPVLRVLAWPESRGRVDVDFSPDGTLASGRTVDGFGISDARTGARLTLQPNTELRAAWFAGDGHSFLTLDASKITVRELERFPSGGGVRMDHRLHIPKKSTTELDGGWISPSRRVFAWSDAPGHVRIARLDNEGYRGSLDLPETPIAVAFSPDEKLIVCSFPKTRTLAFWLEGFHDRPAREFDLERTTASFSPDGTMLALGAPHICRIYDREKWQVLAQFPTDSADGEPNAVAWSPGGKILAFVKEGRRIQLMDSQTWQPVAELAAPEPARIRSLAFSPDGERIAVGTERGRAELWNLVALRQKLAEVRLSLLLPAEKSKPVVPFEHTEKYRTAARPRVQIPPRDPAAMAEQLDLGNYYNFPLGVNWHGDRADNALTLPSGLHTFGGTLFDCRGLLELSSRAMAHNMQDAPLESRGIGVGRPCRMIHFLGAKCLPGPKRGDVIGFYIVHYSDGARWEIPLRCGYETADWWKIDDEPDAIHATEAWRGENGNTIERGGDTHLRLWKYSWQNPRPDVPVASIDFTSTLSDAAPFLVAISVE